jgi:RNA polymerase sigma-70 factor, ECF subfamily
MSSACLQKTDRGQRPLRTAACDQHATWKATLYRAHWSAVRARCQRLLGNREAAEDAAQETFVRAFRNLDDLVDAEQQRRWLFRVASNYCLNLLRDGKRHTELLARLEAVDSADCAAALVARDAASYVIGRMPPGVRRVAWLVYVEEMKQEYVARALGISRRTVITRLAAFRASGQQSMADRGARSPMRAAAPYP